MREDATKLDRSDGNAPPSILGVVSYLNARPLIAGLEAHPEVSLTFAVPSALVGMLRRHEVRLGLIPVVDLVRNEGGLKIVSDCCIGSDGETMTVRVYSRIPPEEVTKLHVDGDSRTSVVLSRVLWKKLYGKQLAIEPLTEATTLADCEAIMLIGDKVVTRPVDAFGYEIDLGGAWKSVTGLPFVFAVWAGRADEDVEFLEPLLSQARDLGVSRVAQIAATYGPELGWPVDLARDYLARRLKFQMDQRMRKGMRLFLELAEQYGYLPGGYSLVSP